MEEWIGERWHRLITRLADPSFADQAVALQAVQRPVELLFRAAGGAPGVRIVPAAAARIAGARSWLQRLAGSGQRAALTRLDGETLALPPVVAVFDDASLNRDLYLWLAALAAVHEPGAGWLAGNMAATQAALQRCPGLQARWQRLLHAHLMQRPALNLLKGDAATAEAAVQAALRGLAPQGDIAPDAVAPVWLWLEVLPAAAAGDALTEAQAARRAQAARAASSAESSATRRRTRRAAPESGRAPLLLPSRAEALMTWSEHVPLDRGSDDQDDGHATAAADDMEQLTLSRSGAAPASRVKFDLDLPSASADDPPLGPGETLPEWDWKQQRLRPAHCSVTTRVATPGAPFVPTATLRATARRVRRRLEVLRAAPQWQRGCADGDAIDLDAWVRHASAGRHGRSGEPPVFARRVRGERSLATLLLADLSLSTDAHANNEQRVIDVIRDALYVFGEALHGTGDAFAMLGFSSVRRSQVRMQHLKGFDEPWGVATQARVGAIKPGYYTRMGAALRLATLRLGERSERQRLLLILTDGKPNDIDVYEGRWGLEDTRHAVMQARQAGLLPFCLSVDEEAHAYLPHLFGRQGWAHVQRPAELPARLATVYARLTR
ncbi:MAG: VWA domain-containing protein [Rubrivivax sp.]|nr:VWA domain-containing protein [Rubrivivax sp.]